MDEAAVLSIAELAERGGVTRRTVRYYVQRGLLPAPAGRGRGGHYGPEHLDRLLQVRGWQEQGVSLDDIAQLLATGERTAVPRSAPVPLQVWSRLAVAPGVELSVAAEAGLSPETVRQLVDAARAVLATRGDGDD